jgi:hypothetical protein
MFPTVEGTNLLRQKKTLPADFTGQINLVFIAFQQWQQGEIDSWSPWITEMEKHYPTLVNYELPTIENRSALARWFINEGMRAGIPNPVTRERTITLYLHKEDFRKSLNIADEDHVQILLVDKLGKVIYRENGIYSMDTGNRLLEKIKEAANIDSLSS